MFKLLAKKMIKSDDTNAIRSAYATLCGVLGIIFNVLLFASKLIAGIVTASLSIIADAFNNLSDASSSVISILGVRLSNKPVDKGHPFGHGRFEYISGLIVSFIIILVGFELGKSAVERIITPVETDLSIFAFIILGASILIKLYMFLYNRYAGKKIDSEVLKATAIDSINDVLVTSAVLITSVITYLTGVSLDAYASLALSLFIIIMGIRSAKDTVNLLLGVPPEADFVKKISDLVKSYDHILGIHDLVFHNYGVGKYMITLHAEVASSSDINEVHDVIDTIEEDVFEKFGCVAVIHMDPIIVDDERINKLRNMVNEKLREIDESFSIHDFRMTVGSAHVNLIFDILKSHETKLTNKEIVERLTQSIKSVSERFNVVAKIEYSYV